MPSAPPLKSRMMDEKDAQLIALLQENGRETLTNLSKKVGLSIDSINKRIKELQRKGILHFAVSIDPRAIGYNLVADIKIKLQNITEEQKAGFIGYLQEHPRVTDIFAIMGNYDLTCVLIAKTTGELDEISTGIRQKFSSIIADWQGMLVMKTYKFDRYDILRL